jgi:hypothetical protein
MAWTNSGWLIVAQATGSGTGQVAQESLLASWQFAGPVGLATPPASAATPGAQVKYLYERYLLREPESKQVRSFWADYVGAHGFAAATNAFATSAEAARLVTGGVILPGH